MKDFNIEHITNKINEIIASRKNVLPRITENYNLLESRIKTLKSVLDDVTTFQNLQKDIEYNNQIDCIRNQISDYIEIFENVLLDLEELRKEFNRETINIGVSGEARVGKSLTLQLITGLKDKQIPSGESYPTTAVRSEIYNSSEEKATIVFKTSDEFLYGYIKPHITNVNKYTNDKIEISNVSDLKGLKLPETLNSQATSEARNSLEKLKDATRCYDSYINLLNNNDKHIPIEQLTSYITYPSPYEINSGSVEERKYLAVKSAKVYCSFPFLGDAKIGLIDMPGLGELDTAVSKAHLSGLEDKVDKVLMILRPHKEKSFVDAGMGKLIDQLDIIQPGVKLRSDLISAGINTERGLERNANDLLSDFNRIINSSRYNDDIQAFIYNAVDYESVREIVEDIIDELASNLSIMDHQKIEYVINKIVKEKDFSNNMFSIKKSLVELLDKLPKPAGIMHKKVKEISRNIINTFNDLESAYTHNEKNMSEFYSNYKEDVINIGKTIDEKLENGFFKESEKVWIAESLGQKDYLNYYRDECKRIRREIINKYSMLDTYYNDTLITFKNTVVESFIQSLSLTEKYFGIESTDDVSQKINKIIIKFKGKVDCIFDLEQAFTLLSNLNYNFRSNTFLRIEQHLQKLLYPQDIIELKDGRRISKAAQFGTTKYDDMKKIKDVKCILKSEASEVNKCIKESLLNKDDDFYRFISASLSFFMDYLFRKDEEIFKFVVIKGIIGNNTHVYFKDNVIDSNPNRYTLERAINNIENLISNHSNIIRHNVNSNEIHNKYDDRPLKLKEAS